MKETPEQIISKCVNNIVREIASWKYIQKYGCNDPFWPDGCNMNISPVLYPGAWNSDYFKDRNRRGSRARRSRLSSGWRVSDTVICDFFRLDCAKDSEVG